MFLRDPGGADGLFYFHICGRGERCGVGADEPDLRAYEQLVSLCEAVRCTGRMYRLYGPEV